MMDTIGSPFSLLNIVFLNWKYLVLRIRLFTVVSVYILRSSEQRILFFKTLKEGVKGN